MKPRGIEPVWMSILGYVIAPVACGVNTMAVDVLVRRNTDFGMVMTGFASSTVLALFYCPLLGLVSKGIVLLWQNGKTQKARWFSGCFGVSALIISSPLVTFVEKSNDYIFAAMGVVPFLWLVCFVVFAVFARPPKS